MDIQAPLMRYHGGKFRMAPWVIQHFPPHMVYVEAFGGAAGVLLRKERSSDEVYNDLDDEIVNVFRVVRDEASANELARICALTPYARAELDLAKEPWNEPIERARRTLFRAWASFGSAGATSLSSGFRTYTRPDMRYSEVAGSWDRIKDIIPAVTERLRGVIIENRPAIDVMQQHDHEKTLHYVDPPYLHETRCMIGGKGYRHEMTTDQHIELLKVITSLEGMVVLSGYNSDLYRDMLIGWHRVDRNVSACSNNGSKSMTECLWINPEAQKASTQMDLFTVMKPA